MLKTKQKEIRPSDKLRTILVVVDTDTIFKESLVDYLSYAHFNVITASDLATTINAVKQQEVDVLICDLKSSEADNQVFIEAIHSLPDRQPQLIISLLSHNLPTRQNREQEGIIYLTKPFEPDDLLNSLQAL